MRPLFGIFLFAVLSGCGQSTSPLADHKPTYDKPVDKRKWAEKESLADQRRRTHIYTFLNFHNWEKHAADERAAIASGQKPPPIKRLSELYDDKPIDEVYDIARFQYGYKEPK